MDPNQQSNPQINPILPPQYYQRDESLEKESNPFISKWNIFILLLAVIILGGFLFFVYSNPNVFKKRVETSPNISTVSPETIEFVPHTNLLPPTQSPTKPPVVTSQVFAPTTALTPISTSTPIPSITGSSNQDITSDKPIKIVGNQQCIDKNIRALQTLKDKLPQYFEQVTKHVWKIECIPQGSGVYSTEIPARVVIGDAVLASDDIWYPGTLVHESMHAKLYRDYFETHPGEVVLADIYSGKDAEQKCIDVQVDALAKIGADQAVIDYAKNSINANYWDVPYDQRNW